MLRSPLVCEPLKRGLCLIHLSICAGPSGGTFEQKVTGPGCTLLLLLRRTLSKSYPVSLTQMWESGLHQIPFEDPGIPKRGRHETA